MPLSFLIKSLNCNHLYADDTQLFLLSFTPSPFKERVIELQLGVLICSVFQPGCHLNRALVHVPYAIITSVPTAKIEDLLSTLL